MKNLSAIAGACLVVCIGVTVWVGVSRAQAQPQPQARGGRAGGGRGGSGRGQQDPFAGADLSPKSPVLPLSPAEEATHFILPSGYRLTPVLTDPDIFEPMQIAFDGNGRMFVLEMRSYMQDADANHESDPISRISLHEDTKGAGVYDKHSVFVDHLVAPRFVLPFGPNSILTMETNGDDVFRYTDTDGDGIADKKELFTSDFGRSGNLEHQQSTLFWGLDNWLYSTVNAFRVRWTPSGVKRETTGSNGAQWGVTQNNYGKIYFQGGASGLPAYFQFPVHYGNFNVPDEQQQGLRVPWGAPVKIADMQGGMGQVRMPDGSLSSTTAGAGNNIYRGDRLPKELAGDYFYGEVVARVVRRLKEVNTEGLNQLQNVYQDEHSEFIRSTDPLFRPVYTTNAPDGTMYITDPYRGIIQQGTWVNPGSYLRAKVEQYQLDKVTNHGRIWRLTYDGMDRDKAMPHMNNETAAQLVAHLNHPNGWWRDTAQHLLVLKQDKSVVPQLLAMAKGSPNQLARIHALWTLEGLNSLDAATVRGEMKDPDPQIRIQAIRVSETLYKAGDRSFQADYKTATLDKNTDVAIQAMLTEKLFKPEDLSAIIKSAQAANTARGVQLVGAQILDPTLAASGRGGGPGRGGPPPLSAEQQAIMQKGEAVFKEVCFTCHGDDGRGEPLAGKGSATKAPSLSGSPRVQGHRDYVIKAVMYGLRGPIDGRNYSEVMVPNGGNKNEWIASVASYVRNSFGNSAGFVSVDDVARIRLANPTRSVKQDKNGVVNTRFTIPELVASLPRAFPAQLTWKASASDSPNTATGGFGFLGWRTPGPQKAGMWYQVELPSVTSIMEIQFDSPASGGGRGGGRGASGGRGGAVVAAGPGDPAGVPAGDQIAAGPGGFGGPGGPGGGGPPNSPLGYKVQVSIDGKTWSEPVAEGKGGDSANIIITFKAVKAKFVRITETESADNARPWSIQKLRFYEAPAPLVASVRPAAGGPTTTAQKK